MLVYALIAALLIAHASKTPFFSAAKRETDAKLSAKKIN